MKHFKVMLLAMLFTVCMPVGVSHAAQVNEKAPDFVLKSRAGTNLRLSELRGQVVMINFWASWCGPCRQEMPLLEKLYRRYKKLGFTLLGVNVEKDSHAAQAFLKGMNVSFPILYDKDNSVSRLYQVSGMPSTIVVDRDGKLRYRHTGFVPGDEQKYSKMIRTAMKP